MNNNKAFTLVELVISIVIIAICLTGTMLAFITVAKFGEDPMIQQQAISIGKSYLEEIITKSFPQTLPCHNPPIGGRAVFENVCDYNGLNNVGAEDQNGKAIPNLNNYTVRVTLDTAVAVLGTLSAGTSVIRVDVIVSHPALTTAMVISGYRTNY
jgi:MSHA pilin protein MshD